MICARVCKYPCCASSRRQQDCTYLRRSSCCIGPTDVTYLLPGPCCCCRCTFVPASPLFCCYCTQEQVQAVMRKAAIGSGLSPTFWEEDEEGWTQEEHAWADKAGVVFSKAPSTCSSITYQVQRYYGGPWLIGPAQNVYLL